MPKNPRAAFHWITKLLRKLRIPFRVSGGLAARFYGSKRPLADIDMDIPDKDIPRLAPEVRRYIIYGPQRYRDRHWDLPLLTLRYRGQLIDLSGADSGKVFDKRKRKKVIAKVHLRRFRRGKLFGVIVPIIPKTELIAYKSALGRRVDVADVKAISKTF